jgi:hypothetical protein
MFLESFYMVIKGAGGGGGARGGGLFFFLVTRVQNLNKNKFINLGQFTFNYIVQNSDFFGGKIKSLMEYLKIYHLLKWNHQN